MSAYGSNDRSQMLTRHGFAAFIPKPIQESALFNTVANALGQEGIRHPEATSQTNEPPHLDTCKLLLTEDIPINQEVALGLLEDTKATITIANNGREAVEAVQREAFDLVFMDI